MGVQLGGVGAIACIQESHVRGWRAAPQLEWAAGASLPHALWSARCCSEVICHSGVVCTHHAAPGVPHTFEGLDQAEVKVLVAKGATQPQLAIPIAAGRPHLPRLCSQQQHIWGVGLALDMEQLQQ
jgi:hypothetical protein